MFTFGSSLSLVSGASWRRAGLWLIVWALVSGASLESAQPVANDGTVALGDSAQAFAALHQERLRPAIEGDNPDADPEPPDAAIGFPASLTQPTLIDAVAVLARASTFSPRYALPTPRSPPRF
ncbi:MAG TPA: hypothetical protein VFN16_07840 [Saccharospirillum sp.]|nr:hypothetical protein [Saccharospirillum sp.]